ncbi:MAG: DUF1638 domain-containing protein [Phycisphaerae bacterium]
MLLKLISCNVFLREACWCIARSPHVVDPEFTELGEHVHAPRLRELIQGRIDAAENSGKAYDAILVLFGLCGNATVGLQARKIPLVIPRAHDCCTILLGSKARFQEHFGATPSTLFSSSGYFERGNYFLRTGDDAPTVQMGDAYAELVKQYGQEDADYVWQTMHPKSENPTDNRAVFINLPQTTELGIEARFQAKAQEEGKQFVSLPGDIRLIENLLFGKWDAAEFLTVKPGQATAGVYDFDQVLKAE